MENHRFVRAIYKDRQGGVHRARYGTGSRIHCAMVDVSVGRLNRYIPVGRG